MGRRLKISPGEVYGSLEVLRRAGSTKNGLAKWECLCKKCGRKCVVVGRDLTAGRGTWRKTDCGCLPPDHETAVNAGKAAIPVNVRDGVQVYVATKDTPNRGSTTGFRWVRVIRQKGREWIYAQFQLKGQKYYIENPRKGDKNEK